MQHISPVHVPGHVHTFFPDIRMRRTCHPILCPSHPILYPSHPIIYPGHPILYPILYPSHPILYPSQPILYPSHPILYPSHPILYPSHPILYPILYPSHPILYPRHTILYPRHPILYPSYPILYPSQPILYPGHPILYPILYPSYPIIYPILYPNRMRRGWYLFRIDFRCHLVYPLPINMHVYYIIDKYLWIVWPQLGMHQGKGWGLQMICELYNLFKGHVTSMIPFPNVWTYLLADYRYNNTAR